jgi:hypothetical protein
MAENALKLEGYVDNFDPEKADKDYIREELKKDSDANVYHFARPIFKDEWWGTMHMSFRIVSPIIHFISWHMPL